ncbi:MAG TPA: VOC family protein [Vicinamibacterales bacterium]|nr:VOC family protein [Vicinamibacterales bacterium]
MAAVFKSASPYQKDAMNLPVADVGAAVPFYEKVMGFKVVSRQDLPHERAVLARDSVQIGLAENGGQFFVVAPDGLCYCLGERLATGGGSA